MAFEKHYTARQAAEAVLKKAQELLSKSEFAKAEKSKHDRCVEHVKENSPGVNNPHAVCVAEGVKPASWNKSEEKLALIKSGMSPNAVEAQLAKYETENSKKLGYKLPEAGRHEKESVRTDKDYKVEASAPHNAAGPESPASHSHPEVQKSEQDRLRQQPDPQKNPKEQAEGNNELAGTTPTQVGQDGKNIMGYDEMKGHLKLAKFIGRMEHKRTKKPGLPV